MFIFKDIEVPPSTVTEADEEPKPTCEVHAGNLFVQLHFKALKTVPADIKLVNTLVTSGDESSAGFSGCGKHLIAVRTEDEETPLDRSKAFKCIQGYLNVLFGQDVGNSIKEEDIETVSAEGEIMTDADLQKWAEQEKAKKEGGGESDTDDRDVVDESIPSFRRFMVEDEAEPGDEATDAEPGDEATDAEPGDEATDAEPGDEATDAEEGKEGTEAESGDEADLPPPATYMLAYDLGAEGQSTKDFTQDTKTIEQQDKDGKLILPGSKFNPEIGFRTIGGGSDDSISLKKLGKELAGKFDSEKLQSEVQSIFSKNFPKISDPTLAVRDSKTIVNELNMKLDSGDISSEHYNAEVINKIKSANYGFYIEIQDDRLKPEVEKSDICNVINGALKRITGVQLSDLKEGIGKAIKGAAKLAGKGAKKVAKSFKNALAGVRISEKDVILIPSKSKLGNIKDAAAGIIRSLPTPNKILDIIDGKNQIYKKNPNNIDSPKIWGAIEQAFARASRENQSVKDPNVAEMLKIWSDFQKKYHDRSAECTSYGDYETFYKDYEKKYKQLIRPRLDESFLSERDLMRSLFGSLYEEDDFEEGGDDEGGSESSDGGDDKSKYTVNIFVVPMKGLDVAFKDNRY